MDNIKDFILRTETLDPESGGQTIAARKPSAVEYSIVFASGPDFAVRRKTKMGSKVLVFLVSQSQYYIKDEKKECIDEFSSAGYTKFMSDSTEPIPLTEEVGTHCNWLTALERGKAFGDALEEAIRAFNEDPDLRSAAMHNWLMFDGNDLYQINGCRMSRNIAASETVIRKVLSVCAEYVSEDEVKRAFSLLVTSGTRLGDKMVSALCSLLERHNFGYRPPAITATMPQSVAEILMEEYGLSGLEELLREYFRVAVASFPSYMYFFDLFHICEYRTRYASVPQLVSTEKRRFRLKDFKHYLWYQSVLQGYAADIENFITSWTDSLRMQEIIYGKITEKYPEHLASCEKKLSFKYNQLKEEIDEAQWGAMVNTMSGLEYRGKTYSMICPKAPADVVDEAQQQSNCVASYVRDIINGRCMIFFCRFTKMPERSLVTVEIRADGSLGQVKARFNRAPAPEVRAFVDKWYDEVVRPSAVWTPELPAA